MSEPMEQKPPPKRFRRPKVAKMNNDPFTDAAFLALLEQAENDPMAAPPASKPRLARTPVNNSDDNKTSTEEPTNEENNQNNENDQNQIKSPENDQKSDSIENINNNDNNNNNNSNEAISNLSNKENENESQFPLKPTLAVSPPETTKRNATDNEDETFGESVPEEGEKKKLSSPKKLPPRRPLKKVAEYKSILNEDIDPQYLGNDQSLEDAAPPISKPKMARTPAETSRENLDESLEDEIPPSSKPKMARTPIETKRDENENNNSQENENNNSQENENINSQENENINSQENENINSQENENINSQENENNNSQENENNNSQENENINSQENENINSQENKNNNSQENKNNNSQENKNNNSQENKNNNSQENKNNNSQENENNNSQENETPKPIEAQKCDDNINESLEDEVPPMSKPKMARTPVNQIRNEIDESLEDEIPPSSTPKMARTPIVKDRSEDDSNNLQKESAEDIISPMSNPNMARTSVSLTGCENESLSNQTNNEETNENESNEQENNEKNPKNEEIDDLKEEVNEINVETNDNKTEEEEIMGKEERNDNVDNVNDEEIPADSSRKVELPSEELDIQKLNFSKLPRTPVNESIGDDAPVELEEVGPIPESTLKSFEKSARQEDLESVIAELYSETQEEVDDINPITAIIEPTAQASAPNRMKNKKKNPISHNNSPNEIEAISNGNMNDLMGNSEKECTSVAVQTLPTALGPLKPESDLSQRIDSPVKQPIPKKTFKGLNNPPLKLPDLEFTDDTENNSAYNLIEEETLDDQENSDIFNPNENCNNQNKPINPIQSTVYHSVLEDESYSDEDYDEDDKNNEIEEDNYDEDKIKITDQSQELEKLKDNNKASSLKHPSKIPMKNSMSKTSEVKKGKGIPSNKNNNQNQLDSQIQNSKIDDENENEENENEENENENGGKHVFSEDEIRLYSPLIHLRSNIRSRLNALASIAKPSFPATQDREQLLIKYLVQAQYHLEYDKLDKKFNSAQHLNDKLRNDLDTSYPVSSPVRFGQGRELARLQKEVMFAESRVKRMREEIRDLQLPPKNVDELQDSVQMSLNLTKSREEAKALTDQVKYLETQIESTEKRISLMTQKKSLYHSPRLAKRKV